MEGNEVRGEVKMEGQASQVIDMLKKVIKVYGDVTLTPKEKVQGLQKVKEEIRAEYKNYVKSLISNELLLNIVDKMSDGDTMLLEKNDINGIEDLLQKYKEISDLIKLFNAVSKRINVEKSTPFLRFYFMDVDITVVILTYTTDSHALRVALPEQFELIKVNKDMIEYVPDYENLVWKILTYANYLREKIIYYNPR